MGLQASNQTGTATAALLLGAGTFNTSLREFLALKPGLTGYGIDIPRVQEIRSDEESIRVANAPAFVKGVVNLRGAIVPVIDMRFKFNLDTVGYADSLSRSCSTSTTA